MQKLVRWNSRLRIVSWWHHVLLQRSCSDLRLILLPLQTSICINRIKLIASIYRIIVLLLIERGACVLCMKVLSFVLADACGAKLILAAVLIQSDFLTGKALVP